MPRRRDAQLKSFKHPGQTHRFDPYSALLEGRLAAASHRLVQARQILRSSSITLRLRNHVVMPETEDKVMADGPKPSNSIIRITCSGSPTELGREHGEVGASRIAGSIAFYKAFFAEKTGLDWTACTKIASKWLPYLERNVPWLVEEMRAMASSSGQPFSSILALNVRTEIAYGMYSDGCTSFSYRATDNSVSYIAQNWDWSPGQAGNLVHLVLHPSRGPRMSFITEAGIIGKIGMNSSSVGVCLNALRAKGANPEALPVHLALRVALESTSAAEAFQKIEKLGVAASAYIMVADDKQSFGVECCTAGRARAPAFSVPLPKAAGYAEVVPHTNHMIELHSHEDVDEENDMPDSLPRLNRITELIKQSDQEICGDVIRQWLSDEEGAPYSINRMPTNGIYSQTLFTIVMNLKEKKAKAKMGNPTGDGQIIYLKA